MSDKDSSPNSETAIYVVSDETPNVSPELIAAFPTKEDAEEYREKVADERGYDIDENGRYQHPVGGRSSLNVREVNWGGSND